MLRTTKWLDKYCRCQICPYSGFHCVVYNELHASSIDEKLIDYKRYKLNCNFYIPFTSDMKTLYGHFNEICCETEYLIDSTSSCTDEKIL
jgi:hypothetical protein